MGAARRLPILGSRARLACTVNLPYVPIRQRPTGVELGTSYGNAYGKSVDMLDMCAQLMEAGGEQPGTAAERRFAPIRGPFQRRLPLPVPH